MMHRITAEQRFLRECNANRTFRIFGPRDYRAYRNALAEAKTALRSDDSYYYKQHHAGTEFAGYKHPVETAAWAVWVLHGAVRSEYGSRVIENGRLSLQYSHLSYWKAWPHREWGSPSYSIGPDFEVQIFARWQVSNGSPCGRAEMSLITLDGLSPDVPPEIMDALPRKLLRVLKGTSWKWPNGVLEADCESMVRERANEIIELLPAFAIVLASA